MLSNFADRKEFAASLSQSIPMMNHSWQLF